MAEDENRTPQGGQPDERLAELGRKLEATRRQGGPQASSGSASTAGMGQALKLGSEFAAGVIVGFVIGYAIDHVFGTRPWAMIVFLLLGFAAGVLNVMRAAGKLAKPSVIRKDDTKA